MNATLSGNSPAIASRTLSVHGLRVLVDGRRPAAGDGVARELARMVDASIPADASERAITADQTNVSVIVGERLVVKIVGEWGACDRSARLLSALAEVEGVERLVGAIDWEHPELGGGTLALVTEYLPGAVDGWTWAVDDVLAHLDGAPAPRWPGELGTRVARIHAALADGLEPAPADLPSRLRDRLPAVLDDALAAARGDTRRRLENRAGAIRAVLRGVIAPTAVLPIHGDLHVGQILRTGPEPVRWAIIDFDGDPQLPAAERDLAGAAARDVAHLRVSFDMVAAVVQKRLCAVDVRAAAWADTARDDLLGAYTAALPPAPATALFDPRELPALEAEQLLRELLYAERFLPRWAYAADEAITRRFPASDPDTEAPWTPPPSAATSN